MEIEGLKVRGRYTFQSDGVMGSGSGDDGVGTGITRRRQNFGDAAEQVVIDLDCVIGDVKIANGRGSKAGIEHEIVVSAAAKDRDAVANVVERLISGRAADNAEPRRVR